MVQFTTFLRSLGSDGAVANVRHVLEARQREEWVVDGLSRKLEAVPQVAVARRVA
ncbi:MAG: hypothetical protein Q8K58_01900 [Acidimicrobiales bacterium]|nr:hypothetical protein [Acidimicrobiales bacterium]